jgi:RNA polymerase sigma-70 factor (ECF subfamily)
MMAEAASTGSNRPAGGCVEQYQGWTQLSAASRAGGGRKRFADVGPRTADRPGAQSERRLAGAIAGAKQGDWDAVRFLYVRYADDVYGYVVSIVRDAHEAEDVTHNVFAKLMSAIAKYEQREVPFTAWILRVARNAALDHLRKQRQIPCDEVRSRNEGHEQVGFDRNSSLLDAIDSLPEEQREVVLLRHVAGLSPAEIAAALNKTEGAIHGLHHRGRGTLRATLRELGAAPVTSGG